ncbi:MAG: hypothetical protein HZA93_11430 [Verrucomicrobia bacterium]|nr:hypothetical protein [Verrucomicrobiota bacterium]
MLSALGVVRAEVPRPLQDALAKLAQDTDRWAYTQTLVERDDKGRVKQETVVRFDPSQPYAQQYRVIRVDGKEPSDSQVRKFRRQGEKRGERAEREEREGPDPKRKTVGELMDLERATIAEENDRSVTYAVPLKKEGNNRFPPEKFEVTARVSKALGAFESVAVKLRAPIREKLILNIKSGEGSIDFTPVDAKYAPQMTAIRGGGSGSIFFVPIGRHYEVKREDFKRVKPFGDRFEVKIGPLKAIDF